MSNCEKGAPVLGLAVLLSAGGPACQSWAQAASATPGPDVLTLSNGDHLAGKILSEANGTVTFHSDGAGDLTLTWDKIKSIQTAGKFAVIQQGSASPERRPTPKYCRALLSPRMEKSG